MEVESEIDDIYFGIRHSEKKLELRWIYLSV